MKIISGGQTGVDRAALDAALETGLPCGGWCPKGRRAEDGAIDKKYPLSETSEREYEVRTARNVLESSATLILTRGKPSSGTAYTLAIARINKKPSLVVDLTQCEKTGAVAEILDWFSKCEISVLNVAGPRESNAKGIYKEARDVLVKVFKEAESLWKN